ALAHAGRFGAAAARAKGTRATPAGAVLGAASPHGTLWVIMGSLGRQSTARAHPAPRLDWNLHGPLMGCPLKEWLSGQLSGAALEWRRRPGRDATLSSG